MIPPLHPRSRLSAAFTLTATIFYLPANLFPFMTMELYGRTTSSTVWTGVRQLIDDGSFVIAIVVFLASILIPALKLIILVYLAWFGANGHRVELKRNLYKFVELVGRWSMLDIFLLAILVAMLKLGRWASVRPELGATMFAALVIFTMLGSACFDPEVLGVMHEEA